MIRKKRFLILYAVLMSMSLLLVACNDNSNVIDNTNEITNEDNETTENINNASNDSKEEDTSNGEEVDNNSNNNVNEEETLNGDNIKNQEALIKLLPEKEGYKWVYNGFVEYAHRGILNSIEEKDNKIIYSIEGEVDDVSDGESKNDYTISQKYIIENGKLIQEKEETMMMDSNFDSIVLIQLPLEVGNTWNQKVDNKNGDEVNLNCFIKDIEEEEGKKIYTIRYEDIDSNYYEERKIEEGIGTISFQKLFKTDEDEFEIGYGIYMEASGY